MRILAIAPTSFFADYGCHVRIWGQLRALIRRGHEVRLITYPSGRDRAPIPTVRPRVLRGWPIQVGSSWKKIALDITLAPLVIAAALRFRPQVVYAFLHEGVALALPVRAAGIPLVFDYQGSLTAEMLTHGFLSPRSPLLPLWRGLEHFLDARADLVFTSTDHARNDLLTRGVHPPGRVVRLPDAVDPDTFRPRRPGDEPRLNVLSRKWGIPPERPIIAYLGLLAPYQGIDVLLRAFRILLDEWHGDARPLLLLMGFPFVDRYRAQAQSLGLEEDVIFTGPMPYDQAPEHLRLARIAVAPKRPVSEGAGKLLPYMATGLPVVATDTPAHRAYLEDDAYYAAVDDPASLAQALIQALGDPEAVQRGHRLRERVLAEYTWDHAGALIEEGIKRVLRLGNG